MIFQISGTLRGGYRGYVGVYEDIKGLSGLGFRGSHNKDYSILGSILGSPILRTINLYIRVYEGYQGAVKRCLVGSLVASPIHSRV